MDNQNGVIYNAKELGTGRVLVLGLQHMFAMFGATVLVPKLTGLSVSATLLFAGIATLFMHLVTNRKVPVFLGSSFAFLGGYAAIAPNGEKELLPYACVGVAAAGLVYLILALIIKAFGQKKVLKYFPPIVTGPIIIAIGLCLSGSAIQNCQANWIVALIAIAVVIICNIWGKGMVKIIPILLGVVASYVVSLIIDPASRVAVTQAVNDAAWFGLPVDMRNTVFGLFSGEVDGQLIAKAIITIVPISLATMMEHVGDISAISSTVGKNFIEDPGLHRTLIGDGVGTTIAALFGAPANTTYGENTGVLALTKVFDPMVIRLAAVYAIVLSFCPKFAALIEAMPTATIGGVSLILYGMISAVGVRNVVENKIDFSNTRNIIVAALILVLAIGIKYGAGDSFMIGKLSLTGLAVASIVGIVLNAVLAGKEGLTDEGADSANLGRF
ncbi:MAG: uracil-xanthine permease family protein [Clostridia bacterium]|nr:uracil-xanthine permease family protein [Clostridia bacterium]